MGVLPKRYFTPDEYLELESKANYRSQYVAGEIYAMAGAQPWHLEITANLIDMLYNQLRGKPCKTYSAEIFDSLTDYVLVASERMGVEHFTRQSDGSWTFREYHAPDHRLPLAGVGCELPLAEIYERVTFPEPGSGG